VLHAVETIRGYDIVVLLQPTSPLRTASDVDSCLEQLVASGAPSCVAVSPAECHPYLTFELSGDGVLRSFIADKSVTTMRRQDFPDAWRLNGAVYAARIPWLIEARTFVGLGTVGYLMAAAKSLDIDTLEDRTSADAALSRIHDRETAGKSR